MGWIEPPRGLETLEQLIVEQHVQAGVLPIDWRKFFERIPAGSEPAWLLDIAREARSADSAQESGPPVLLEKLQSVTPAERLEVALTFIRQQAARVLAMDDANLPDPRRTLNEVGFDSLTGVEFCNRVGRSVGQHLNPAVLFDYPTLERLCRLRGPRRPANGVRVGSASAAGPAGKSRRTKPGSRRWPTWKSMSEEEMDALVTQQLEKLQP